MDKKPTVAAVTQAAQESGHCVACALHALAQGARVVYTKHRGPCPRAGGVRCQGRVGPWHQVNGRQCPRGALPDGAFCASHAPLAHFDNRHED